MRLLRWEVGLVVAFFAIVALGSASSSQFLTKGNLFYLCLSIGELAIMTLPLALIIIVGRDRPLRGVDPRPLERDARLPRPPRLAARGGPSSS